MAGGNESAGMKVKGMCKKEHRSMTPTDDEGRGGEGGADSFIGKILCKGRQTSHEYVQLIC